MSLYKRGEFYWFDFTLEGQRHRGPTKQRSKTAARKVEDRARAKAALGASDGPVYTIEEASARWFTARIAGRKSEKTTAHRLDIMLRLIGPDTLVCDIDGGLNAAGRALIRRSSAGTWLQSRRTESRLQVSEMTPDLGSVSPDPSASIQVSFPRRRSPLTLPQPR